MSMQRKYDNDNPNFYNTLGNVTDSVSNFGKFYGELVW